MQTKGADDAMSFGGAGRRGFMGGGGGVVAISMSVAHALRLKLKQARAAWPAVES